MKRIKQTLYEKMLNGQMYHTFRPFIEAKFGTHKRTTFDLNAMTGGDAIDIASDVYAGFSNREKGQMVWICYLIFGVSVCGGNIFHVCENLACALSETDPQKDLRLLKVPYDSFFLSFPKGIVSYSLRRDEGHINVGGFFINKTSTDGVPQLEVAAIGSHSTHDAPVLHRFDIRLEKVDNVEDITELNQQGEALQSIMGKEKYLQIISLIINSLLYISSSNKDAVEVGPIVGDAPRNKSKNKTRPSRLGYTLLGGEYSTFKRSQFSYGASPKWRLKQQHFVRGHWRNQIYGAKDNQYHKIIWIEPYIKGPELAESIDPRSYLVE